MPVHSSSKRLQHSFGDGVRVQGVLWMDGLYGCQNAQAENRPWTRDTSSSGGGCTLCCIVWCSSTLSPIPYHSNSRASEGSSHGSAGLWSVPSQIPTPTMASCRCAGSTPLQPNPTYLLVSKSLMMASGDVLVFLRRAMFLAPRPTFRPCVNSTVS